ncbi:MAG: hypothetical protein ACI9DJ_002714 [Algoriphagus sp.]|jgi:hypothetical protein
MNENKRIPNGNLIWIKDKNWGMREFHSNIWKINVEEGQAVYVVSSHTAATFENLDYLKVLKYGIDFISE